MLMAFLTCNSVANISCLRPSNQFTIPSSPFKPFKLPSFWPWQKVKMGPLSVSPMGFGTWAWGNQLLWGYQESMDSELQQVFNFAVENGINLFDTADSYGTGRLNGQSEKLLGKFIREFPGKKLEQSEIVIATKFAAYPWRLTPGQFVKACKASLDRLQIEQIGIGQLHWSTANYAPPQELALWGGLVAMYEKVTMIYSNGLVFNSYHREDIEIFHLPFFYIYFLQDGIELRQKLGPLCMAST
ncbi:hypothetical protein SLEP1_g3213 [Rubroshorea leprosula]|uniref:NADP-dependent oxidoreductase domain-containing protein n=1 Tax=Rubroshorea leprosula TaxID=152421 RepID=A0AAV5HJQ3_9ROSI|nr:hypothetical protein SLEP1_g3213 [Rubroshorea leprosula]